MKRKPKYTVITKVVGILMVLFTLIGLYVVFVSENISLFLFSSIYMIFIFMGGILNILDSGKIDFSKFSCFCYAVALILRTIFDIAIAEKIHWNFLLILLVAFLVSLIRYISVSKVTKSEETVSNKNSATPPNDTKMNQSPPVVNTYQNKCRVGIMRQAKVSGGGSAFTIFVDGVKTTTIKNGGMTQLLLAPGRHVLGFGGIGSKISCSLTIDLTPENDTNVMCYTTLSGIEAVLTSVDVCTLAETKQPVQPQPKRAGCLIGLILLLIVLYILGTKLQFFIFFVPIR